jgi:hypothetical protein
MGELEAERVIVSRLSGGLGNQLFQYYTGLALSLKNDEKLYLDLESFQFDELRKFELYPLVDLNILTKIRKKIISVKLKLKLIMSYYEKSLAFNKEVLKLNNCILNGYFQSEKYFFDIRSVILSNMKKIMERELSMNERAVAKELRSSNSVSIHVRRGDYINSSLVNRVHGVCSLSYYKSAIKYLKEVVEHELEFHIFSDDLAWCRENFTFLNNTTFYNSTLKSPFLDILLMSSCRFNIIANSSYSWWGAWLNEYENKIVIRPSKWFEDETRDSSTICPKEWIKI